MLKLSFQEQEVSLILAGHKLFFFSKGFAESGF